VSFWITSVIAWIVGLFAVPNALLAILYSYPRIRAHARRGWLRSRPTAVFYVLPIILWAIVFSIGYLAARGLNLDAVRGYAFGWAVALLHTGLSIALSHARRAEIEDQFQNSCAPYIWRADIERLPWSVALRLELSGTEVAAVYAVVQDEAGRGRFGVARALAETIDDVVRRSVALSFVFAKEYVSGFEWERGFLRAVESVREITDPGDRFSSLADLSAFASNAQRPDLADKAGQWLFSDSVPFEAAEAPLSGAAIRKATDQVVPESRPFAGFWIRAFAFAIDSFAASCVAFLIGLIAALNPWSSWILDMASASPLLVAIVGFAAWSSYFPACVAIFGNTLGKHLLNLDVIDVHSGAKQTAKQSLLRSAGYYLSSVAFGWGFIRAGWSSAHKGWHDELAGTAVVRTGSIPPRQLFIAACAALLAICGTTALAVEWPAGNGQYADVGSASRSSALQWREYVSSTDHFSVNFPGTPTKRSEEAADPSSRSAATVRHYEVANGGETFSVTVAEYQGAGSADASSHTSLKRAVDGLAEAVNGRVTNQVTHRVDGIPAKDVELEVERATLRSRLIIVGSRLFMVSHLTDTQDGENRFGDFANSFRISPLLL
jgi:uncharacterized RDD family membrane protein YckC